MTEAEDLRARAEKCRHYAREYASEIGASLSELATALEHEADRLDAKIAAPDGLTEGSD
jgi:hypothetical protein